jgi:hypothetical protein
MNGQTMEEKRVGFGGLSISGLVTGAQVSPHRRPDSNMRGGRDRSDSKNNGVVMPQRGVCPQNL